MKFSLFTISLLAVSALAGLFAQDVAAPKPDTVLAVIDGRKVTYGEINAYYTGIGEEARKNAFANPKEMIVQYSLFLRLQDFAKEEKLEDKSPYKESLNATRGMVLAQAALNEGANKVLVTAEDQKKYYEENKDRYTEAKVQVIYLAFVADPADAAKQNPGKTYRSQEEAKAKMEELRKQIKTKEDFVRLVKEFSDDETSKNNDGDFGTIRKSDNVPPDIKQVIFSMKAGEISGPVAQRNGYYLFRIDQVGTQDYDAVKDSIFTELKNTRAKAWVEGLRNKPIEIVDKTFFGDKAPKQ
jgi:parvulin-like peptidyl-prolyl isomerase